MNFNIVADAALKLIALESNAKLCAEAKKSGLYAQVKIDYVDKLKVYIDKIIDEKIRECNNDIE
jgi:hypothetical protein